MKEIHDEGVSIMDACIKAFKFPYFSRLLSYIYKYQHTTHIIPSKHFLEIFNQIRKFFDSSMRLKS